jgi:hypothetical protein
MTDIPTPSHPSLWRRVTALYAKLLEFLLATCLGILIFPVTLQIVSRYTSLIPSYIWTEEMARFLFVWTIMIGAMVGVREALHFEVDVWPDLSRHPGAGAGVRDRRHRIHPLCLEPNVRARRLAAVADPHCLAGGRLHLDRIRRRTDHR